MAGPGPRLSAAPTRIEGVSADGRWLVAGVLHAPALLVTGQGVTSLPGVALDMLDAAALPPLEAVELLLLGTGPSLRRPPAPFVAACRDRGLRVEPMDSRAAARTFNILLAEDRAVAALLL